MKSLRSDIVKPKGKNPSKRFGRIAQYKPEQRLINPLLGFKLKQHKFTHSIKSRALV